SQAYEEMCHCPHCYAGFCKWLKDRYTDVAGLNREWDTTYTSFDEALPLTLKEVQGSGKGNYARWSDYRDFMDDTWAGYIGYLQQLLERYDSQGRLCLSGTVDPGPSNGYDWWKLSKTLKYVSCYDGIQGELTRDFSRVNGMLSTKYSAGYGWTDPELGGYMWRNLLNGRTGIAAWGSTLFRNPDGTYMQSGKDTKARMDEFRGGLWDLVHNAHPAPARVAVLFSMSSLRGSFVTGKMKDYNTANDRTIKNLNDLAVPYSFISYEQLASGVLRNHVYKVLVLPYAVSLSKAEEEAVVEFVRQGGLLIGSPEAGIMDGHCKANSGNLFTRAWGPAPADKGEGMHLYNVGKGYAVCLSDMSGLAGSIPGTMSAFSIGGKSAFQGVTRIFEKNGVQLLGILGDAEGKAAYTVKLPEAAYVYDVRAGKALGLTDTAEVRTGQCEAVILALTDKPLQKLNMSLSAGTAVCGKTVDYSLNITPSIGWDIVHIEVIDPSGRKREEYSANIAVVNGQGRGSIHFALNDPAGTWSIRAVDVIGGLKQDTRLVLK
ncbi:MAG: beta-galactosidase, partial [bacterium]|nr:beta-galactosidase [bacterium]